MINQKKERVIGKKEVLILLGTLIVLGSLAYVFGAFKGDTSMDTSPVKGGNYSGTILLNCSSSANTSVAKNMNATYYFNASGGPAQNLTSFALGNLTGNLTGLIWNSTTNGSAWFYNTTLDTIVGWLPDGKFYNISCVVSNGTGTGNWTSLNNITIDNTPPRVVFVATNVTNNGNYTNAQNITLNISVVDVTIGMLNSSFGNRTGSGTVYINISNSSVGIAPTQNWTRADNSSGANTSGGYFTKVVDLTNYPDGKYNITVLANDSSVLSNITETNVNPNITERIQITVDRNVPTKPTLTNTTSTTTTQIVATISTSDGTGTGIDNCVADSSSGITITGRGTGTQTLTHTGLNCGTSYTYTVTCYDFMGRSNVSDQTSFSTSSCSTSDSGSAGGGGTTTTTAVEKKYSLNIVPLVEAVLSTFQEDMGVKEIKIRVNEEANNVKVTVKKYDTQPEGITVAKAGQVHKYIQITTENLEDKLAGATITFKVQKNWLSDNSVDRANVALFKLDETAGTWDELSATYKEEDTTYYYYEAQVSSFSYFAIAEKTVTAPETPEEEEEEEETTTPNYNWILIVVGVVLLLAIIGGLLIKKRNR